MPRKKATEANPTQRKRKTPTARSQFATKRAETPQAFPIVGLGASAGGLEALRVFFAAVPANSGMAYVVVVHMTPKQPSMMPALLQKVSTIPVSAAQDGQTIAPDHVYVIPPDKDICHFENTHRT